MANKSTTAKVNNEHGQLTVQQHETDSPILPVVQLEQLHSFKPEAVDWVIQQTQIEAEFRRDESKRVNTFVFIERLVGQIFALTIGVTAILSAVYISIKGYPKHGTIIASIAISGLAVTFIAGRKK